MTISAASPGITTVSLYDDFSLDYSYDEDATNILDLSEYLTTGSSLDNDDTITIKISDIDLGDSEDYFAIDENKGS